jgi:hypothetical protein
MINPARLKAERRDSVCAQCHLEGAARIAKVGRTLDSYRPGETLSESLAIFVRADADAHGPGAVSQVESLALSRCKRTAGDALSCITCHDPHLQPTTAQKAGYYRAKCLGCHAALATDHHSRQQDCTACHMPRLDSADIGHTMVTDHRIVPRAAQRPAVNVRTVHARAIRHSDAERTRPRARLRRGCIERRCVRRAGSAPAARSGAADAPGRC